MRCAGICKCLALAYGLVLVQLWGTSDPYCVVSIGDNIAKTTHKKRTLDPIWDEDLRLYVRHVQCICLHLHSQDGLDTHFAKASINQVWWLVHLLIPTFTAPCGDALKRQPRNGMSATTCLDHQQVCFFVEGSL